MASIRRYTPLPPIQTVTDLLPELKKRLQQLFACTDLFSEKCFKNITFLSKIADRADDDEEFGKDVAAKMTDLKIIELYKKMLKLYFNEELFCLDSQNVLWLNFQMMQKIVLSLSQKSIDLCDEIIETKTHADIIRYLTSKSLKPNLLNEESRQCVAQGFLFILLNVAKRAAVAKEEFRSVNAVDVMQSFRTCEQNVIRYVAVMIQAYLVTEEEVEVIKEDHEIFEFLVNLLCAAINGKSHQNVRLAIVDVLDSINSLALNDENKEHIVSVGALPYYVKLMQTDRTLDEQKTAAHGLWILSFKCKGRIIKEVGCIDGKL